MTVNLPEDLESFVRAEVSLGRFASEDALVATAVRAYLRGRIPSPTPAPRALDESIAPAHKPIWEVFQDISAGVPDEEWNKLPTDLAEQHDHYIYGTPKHPVE